MPACSSLALESAKSADLQAALPVPASLAVVRLKPLPGFAFVSVEPDLLLTLLDGFFGGSGRATSDPLAAIAPAAQRFLALMLRSLAADLAAAWTPVTPVEFELVKQETNPRLVQLGAPQESILVLKFTVEFGARSGRMDWLLPEALLAPVREALAADGGQTALRKQEAWGPALTAGITGRRSRHPRDSCTGANQPARAGAPVPGRHHSHRYAAAGDVVRGRRTAVSRPIRRFAGTQRTQNHLRSLHMSTPDPKNAAVARAQFGDLGPNAVGTGGQEMNLNLILDVAVTLALEVGRARMPVRELLQLAPGAVVELDRVAGEPLDVLVNGVRIARGEVVVVNEKFGIRLTDVVSATERMEHAK